MDRYESTAVLQQHGDRRVTLATDRLTHKPVVLKEGPTIDIVREATLLLALPPRTGPTVLDLYSIDKLQPSTQSDDDLPVDQSRCALVMNVLEGQTLDKAVPKLESRDVPDLAIGICNVLAQLHLARFIHGDVKPSNLMVLPGPGRPRVRLLDFGFALGPYTRLTRDTDHLGGTPGYMAPEIAKGWMVDGRADLYSFALVLRALLELRKHDDPRWTPLLDRASQKSASRRFASIREFRDAIGEAFEIPIQEPRPSLGGGPFQGRELLLEKLDKACARKPARQLLCGQPGTGTTRFLLEAWIARRDAILERALHPEDATATEQRQLRVIDLTSHTPTIDAPALDRYLQSLESQAIDVIVGFNDYTPHLTLTPEPIREVLQTRLASDAWRRERIERLDLDTVSDIVGDRLGSASPTTRELGDWVHERSEGDLHLAGRVLDQALAAEGAPHDEGEGWSVSEEGMARLKGMETEAPKPDIEMVPEQLLETAVVLSRLGPRFTEEQARGLLGSLSTEPEKTTTQSRIRQFDELIRLAMVASCADSRLEFSSRALRNSILQLAVLPSREVDNVEEWVLENVRPRPSEPDHVLEFVDLATRRGRSSLASEVHAAALELCYETRQWDSLARLLPTTGKLLGPPADTASKLERSLEEVSARLEAEWGPHRLLVYQAHALKYRAPQVSVLLWERAVEKALSRATDSTGSQVPKSTRPWLLEALSQLLAHNVAREDKESYDSAREMLLSTVGTETPPYDGIVSLFDSWRAQISGDTATARVLSLEAAERLSASQSSYQPLACSYVAILHYNDNPQLALEYLARGRAVARFPVQLLRVLYNEAAVLGNLGRLGEQDETIREATRVINRHGLRDQRERFLRRSAWNLAHLGRLDDALGQVDRLLTIPWVRWSAQHRIPLSALRGYCALQRGRPDEALTLFRSVLRSGPLPLQVWRPTLGLYLDTLLDANCTHEITSEDCPVPQDGSLESRFVVARYNSVRKMAVGLYRESVQTLVENIPQVSTLEPWNQAQLLRHRALARLMTRDGDERAAMLNDSIDDLETALRLTAEYKYLRATVLLYLATARFQSKDAETAICVLSECISLARTLRCSPLLSRSLKLRAEIIGDSHVPQETNK